MIIKCGICGKEFEGAGNRKYCSNECSHIAYTQQNKERWQREKGKPRERNKKPKKRKSQLDAINAEARKLGMTYGQYQAMKYVKEGGIFG